MDNQNEKAQSFRINLDATLNQYLVETALRKHEILQVLVFKLKAGVDRPQSSQSSHEADCRCFS